MNQSATKQAFWSLAETGFAYWSWDPDRMSLRIDQQTADENAPSPELDIFQCLAPNDSALLRSSLKACARDGLPVHLQVQCHGTDDSGDIWLDVRSVRRVYRSDGKIRISGILWDITQLKLKTLSLECSNASLLEENGNNNAFIASISHETRTPLSIILGYTDLALNQTTDQELCANLQQIRNNGVFLQNLFDDLLNVSRIAPTKTGFESKPLELAQLVNDLQAMVRIRKPPKGVKFQVEVADNIPQRISADGVRLRQILQNLLDNALKFTEQGEVRFGISLRGTGNKSELVFEVADTGPGFSPDDMSLLFKPFVRLHPDSPQLGGLGIGLALSKRLAVRIGAALEAETTPGKGSRFRLRFPLTKLTNVMENVRYTATNGSAQGLNARILVVENARSIGNLLTRQLRNLGATVVVSGCATDSIAQARSAFEEGRPFDLFLIDIQMPDSDGFHILHELRAIGYRQPAVALTTKSTSSTKAGYFARRFDALLVRPIDKQRLHQLCTSLLSRYPVCPKETAPRIMLVEDHHALASTTKYQLEAIGYNVRIASCGAEAEQLASTWQPNAVIADLTLPDISGFTLIGRLKKLALRNCRFIAYSGSGEPGDKSTAFSAGFDAYFVKPIDPAILASAIRQQAVA